jgi:predicted nucleic acid-binding protein
MSEILKEIATKAIESNSDLIKKTINKHGTKQKWLVEWLMAKINEKMLCTELYKELETVLPREKFSLVLPYEKAEYRTELRNKLVMRYGLTLK